MPSMKIPFKQYKQSRYLWMILPLGVVFVLVLTLFQLPQATVYTSSFEGATKSTLAGWQLFDPYRTVEGVTGNLYTSTAEAYDGDRSLYFYCPASFQESFVAMGVFFAPDEKTDTFPNPVTGLDDDRTWDYLPPLHRDDLTVNPMVRFWVKLDYKDMLRADVTAWSLNGEAVGAGGAEYEIRGMDSGDWLEVELNIVSLLNSAVGTAGWEQLRSIELRIYNVDPLLRGEPVDLYLDEYELEAAGEQQVTGGGFTAAFDLFSGFVAILLLWRIKRRKVNYE